MLFGQFCCLMKGRFSYGFVKIYIQLYRIFTNFQQTILYLFKISAAILLYIWFKYKSTSVLSLMLFSDWLRYSLSIR